MCSVSLLDSAVLPDATDGINPSCKECCGDVFGAIGKKPPKEFSGGPHCGGGAELRLNRPGAGEREEEQQREEDSFEFHTRFSRVPYRLGEDSRHGAHRRRWVRAAVELRSSQESIQTGRANVLSLPRPSTLHHPQMKLSRKFSGLEEKRTSTLFVGADHLDGLKRLFLWGRPLRKGLRGTGVHLR